MIGLYFYRARNAAAGSSMDLSDASCRPDPDFEALTLGLCRPGLRTKLRRLHQREPVELLFYTHDGRDRILLVAAMRTTAIFRGHAAAQASLSAKGRLPLNIVTAGQPCLRGTVIDPTTLHVIGHRQALPCLCSACGCQTYANRAGTDYIVFDPRTSRLRLRDPVALTFDELKKLLPSYWKQWPSGASFQDFQRSVQNGCHWIRATADVDALRERFLKT